MLVISSNTPSVYEKNRDVWRRYMHSNPNIDCYFIQFRQDVFFPVLTRDTLYLRGKETFKNITQKTILSIQYFLQKAKYTHVVRTNLSSVWDFPELLRFLESKEKTGLYCGIVCEFPSVPSFPYVSGAGIIMSADVAERLVQHRATAYAVNYLDDIDIACALRQASIFPSLGKRVDFISTAHYEAEHDQIPPGTYHYRAKIDGTVEDRERYETDLMNRIVTQIYNK